MINSFTQIGLADEFPYEETNLKKKFIPPQNIDDLVYPSCRYQYDNSPYMLYIPNRLLMFKLMRSCINAKKVEDLWIY